MKKYNFLSNIFIYVGGSFFIQGLRFITLPFFSKLMSPVDYALMSSYEAWISIISVLVGLQAAATINNAYLDYGADSISKYVSNIASLGLISGCSLFIIIAISSDFWERLFEIKIEFLGLGIVQCIFAFYLTLLITEYRIQNKAYYYLVFSITNSFVTVFIGMLLVWILPSNKYIGRIYSSILAALLVGGVAVVIIYKEGKSLVNILHLRYALKLSIPLIFHSFGGIIMGKADQIMLLKMTSKVNMGIYSYGTNFAHIIYVLGNACNLAYQPYYFSLKQKNDINKIQKINRLYMKLYLLLIGGIILMFPEIIKIMSDTNYYNAIYSAPLLAIGFLVNYLYTFPVNYEFYSKKTKHIAYATALTAIINILLNYLLIPFYKEIGAAIATLISMCLQFVFHFFIAQKVIKNYEMPLSVFSYAFSYIVCLTIIYYIFINSIFIRVFCVVILFIICVLLLNKEKKKSN